MKRERYLLLSVIFLSSMLCVKPTLGAQGTQGISSDTEVRLKALFKSGDGRALAYQLARTFLSEAEFKKEVSKIQGKINDWQKDNDGDAGRYLNDRLVIVALSAAGGEVPKIQRGITWLAFYHALDQPAPSAVGKFLREHRGSVTRLLNGFSWEKASEYVKNKKWREDIEERKRLKKLAKAGKKVSGAKSGDRVRKPKASPPIVAATTPLPEETDARVVLSTAVDWTDMSAPGNEDYPLTSP